MGLNFPDKPGRTADELGTDVGNLVEQLERKVLEGESIGTTETKVAHGLKARPRIVHPVPRTEATVWKSTQPDETFIYLTASAAVTCDIEVAL